MSNGGPPPPTTKEKGTLVKGTTGGAWTPTGTGNKRAQGPMGTDASQTLPPDPYYTDKVRWGDVHDRGSDYTLWAWVTLSDGSGVNVSINMAEHRAAGQLVNYDRLSWIAASGEYVQILGAYKAIVNEANSKAYDQSKLPKDFNPEFENHPKGYYDPNRIPECSAITGILCGENPEWRGIRDRMGIPLRKFEFVHLLVSAIVDKGDKKKVARSGKGHDATGVRAIGEKKPTYVLDPVYSYRVVGITGQDTILRPDQHYLYRDWAQFIQKRYGKGIAIQSKTKWFNPGKQVMDPKTGKIVTGAPAEAMVYEQLEP
ncbi:MAG: hypothetical protein FJ291_01685 [Planctomycetes bacterium]|nr:hypothetical protein [Planctomycetota bacterium]